MENVLCAHHRPELLDSLERYFNVTHTSEQYYSSYLKTIIRRKYALDRLTVFIYSYWYIFVQSPRLAIVNTDIQKQIFLRSPESETMLTTGSPEAKTVSIPINDSIEKSFLSARIGYDR